MNTMTRALAEAGIRISGMERIHRWLKDHPGSTALQVSENLKMSSKDTASLCSQMYLRKMLTVREDTRRVGVDRRQRRVHLYSVAQQEYERLPKPVRETVRKYTKAGALPSPVKVAFAQVAAPQPSPSPPPSPIDRMTVREAHALYLELHTYFGVKHAQSV